MMNLDFLGRPAAPRVPRADLLKRVDELADDSDLELLVKLLRDPAKKKKALNAAKLFLR